MKTPALWIKFSKVSGRLVARPANEAAEKFAKIEASENLTGRALAIAKELGIEVYVVRSLAGGPEDLAAYLNPDGR